MMKRYVKYRPSGVDWIGEIPEDWRMTKLRYLSAIETGGKNTEDRVEDGLYPFFVRSQTAERINSFSFDGEAILTAGDGVGVAKVFHYYNGKFDFHQRVYKMSNFTDVAGKFLFYYLKANLYKEVLKWNAKSTVDSLRLPMFQNFLITYPQNIEEQTAIASYLDKKTAQIDDLIAKKQKLIEALKEERTAIINEAVSGEGKDWERKKLKYVARLKSGEAITADVIRPEGEYPVYGGNGLRGYTSSYTHEGDFILIGRQGALCGNINYAKEKFFASEHAVVVSILDSSQLIWLGELLRNMNLNQYSLASAQPGLSVERIQNLIIPVPAHKEQLQIVNYIQSATHKIDNTISKINKEIELIQEYRTAMISEVVTGKIDVRKHLQPKQLTKTAMVNE